MSDAHAFLHDRIGLRVDGTGRLRLDRVVREVASRAGCPQERLGSVLAADPQRAQELIDSVTVQESRFFRHPEQFDFLAGHLRALPAAGTIWSAGCANGQEAWSLAMLLEEQALDGWDVLATDVSAAALRRAWAGVYEERELRGLSAARARRFVPGGHVASRLRACVRFARHNVATAPPPAEAGRCPVVLCRNVLIYLHRAAAEAFLDGLRRRMDDGALLVVGTAEALGRLDGFAAGEAPGTFVRRTAAQERS